jgi:hypothetical protein
MFMPIPCQCDQDVDIQKIHGLFLGQRVRDILCGNGALRVMHQNAILAIGGGDGGKLRLRFAILRDGELLAARDLPEQIRERGLGFFKGDRLHNAKTLTLLPAQGQFFSRAGARPSGRFNVQKQRVIREIRAHGLSEVEAA